MRNRNNVGDSGRSSWGVERKNSIPFLKRRWSLEVKETGGCIGNSSQLTNDGPATTQTANLMQRKFKNKVSHILTDFRIHFTCKYRSDLLTKSVQVTVYSVEKHGGGAGPWA